MKNLNLKKLDLEFDSANHRYTLNGEWIPGCSSISGMFPKDWLAPWASKMATEHMAENFKPNTLYTKQQIDDMLYLAKVAHTRRKETAAEKGTSAHAWFEQRIKTGKEPPMPEDEEIQNCINHFKNWEKNNNVEWLASEVMMASETYKCAGTCDGIAVINGKTALIDFKTSKVIGIEYFVQLAGYQLMLEEMGFKDIEERWVLRFPKEKKDGYEVKKIPTKYEDDKKVFLAAMELYRYVNMAKKLNQ